jgi:hypothetical protein
MHSSSSSGIIKRKHLMTASRICLVDQPPFPSHSHITPYHMPEALFRVKKEKNPKNRQ